MSSGQTRAWGRPAHMDHTEAIAEAARRGNVGAVRDWLANGGAADAAKSNGMTLLEMACMSSRPSCASVAEMLCAAGARVDDARADGRCPLKFAAFYGAVDTVRVLLRYGAPINDAFGNGGSALHHAVTTNWWSQYSTGNPWPIARAKTAASMGHQGVVRLLLKHGAAVNAALFSKNVTPLMTAARFSGFGSLGVVRELLAFGADLDAVTVGGRNAERVARMVLQKAIYTGEGIPENPESCRRPGAVEAFLALLGEVRAAGSWKRYANEPRVQLVVLRKLAESGRAVATRGVATRLFAPRRRLQAMGSRALPDVLFWKILEFWRTDRDP